MVYHEISFFNSEKFYGQGIEHGLARYGRAYYPSKVVSLNDYMSAHSALRKLHANWFSCCNHRTTISSDLAYAGETSTKRNMSTTQDIEMKFLQV